MQKPPRREKKATEDKATATEAGQLKKPLQIAEGSGLSLSVDGLCFAPFFPSVKRVEGVNDQADEIRRAGGMWKPQHPPAASERSGVDYEAYLTASKLATVDSLLSMFRISGPGAISAARPDFEAAFNFQQSIADITGPEGEFLLAYINNKINVAVAAYSAKSANSASVPLPLPGFLKKCEKPLVEIAA